MFKNKTIFISGGTGSFGNAFIEKVINYKPKKISHVLNIPTDKFESLTLIRYERGQEFKKHFDVGGINHVERRVVTLFKGDRPQRGHVQDMYIHICSHQIFPTTQARLLPSWRTTECPSACAIGGRPQRAVSSYKGRPDGGGGGGGLAPHAPGGQF